MAGIRIGGTAVLPPDPPDIPILAWDSGLNERSIWKIGNGATPERMINTVVTSLGTPQIHLGDPQREPTTGDTMVYSKFQTTGTITREVMLADWDGVTTAVQLYNDTTGGAGGSCQPMWKPDGTKILFRALGGGGLLTEIKIMDPDGSNVQTLYSGTTEVFSPMYNHGFGTKIAWVEGTDVHVMDDDGSNESVIYTGTTLGASVAWAWDNTTIAFFDTVADDRFYIVIQADGTGQTTWLTVDESAYGPSQQNPALILYSWTNNDEILTTIRALADPDPDAKLGVIDSGGLTYISPAEYAAADSGGDDLRPCAITGFLEGVERFFWYEDLVSSLVVSVLPDGSDKRTDFDGSALTGLPVFHGFRGDTAN